MLMSPSLPIPAPTMPPMMSSAELSGGGAEMSLFDHLNELRRRLLWSAAAVVVAAIVVWIFQDPLFDVLAEPYCEIRPPDDCNFLATRPLEPFSVKLTMAGYGGLILGLPVMLYHLARFVLPGLYPNERKMLIPFVIASVVLLMMGMAVAYYTMPQALRVLLSFGGDQFEAFFSASEYLSFFVKMVFAFGLAFELPVIITFLQLAGLVQTSWLKKNRRFAVVAVVIVGAIVTPTGDPFFLAVISVPMYLFYEIALLIGGRFKAQQTQ